MDAGSDAIVAAQIEVAKEDDGLDSEDETYLDNEEIAHRQNMVPRSPQCHATIDLREISMRKSS